VPFLRVVLEREAGDFGLKTPFHRLSALGWLQLGSYALLILWSVVAESIYRYEVDISGGRSGSTYPTHWVPLGILGLLLVPSAVLFIRAKKLQKLMAVRVSRVIQIVLFGLVVLLTYPAYILAASAFPSLSKPMYSFSELSSVFILPIYFVACVLGIASFPFMMILVKKTLRSRSIDETRT
jgi:hypothetical protein